MLYSFKKNMKMSKHYNNVEMHKFFINMLMKNDYFFYDINMYNKLSNIMSISSVSNSCSISGRSSGVFNKFSMSSFVFKFLSLSGSINGSKKF